MLKTEREYLGKDGTWHPDRREIVISTSGDQLDDDFIKFSLLKPYHTNTDRIAERISPFLQEPGDSIFLREDDKWEIKQIMEKLRNKMGINFKDEILPDEDGAENVKWIRLTWLE